MIFHIVCLFSLSHLVVTTHDVVNFDGYSVLRIQAHSPAAHHYVKTLLYSPGTNVWSRGNGRDLPIDLMMPPSTRSLAERKLVAAGIRFEVVIEDVQQLIDSQLQEVARSRRSVGPSMDLESFNSYDDILKWMDEMVRSYPRLAAVHSIGNTYEKREMKLIKIGTDPRKPIVWIDGGIHAREWLSPATVIWFINKLLTNYDTDPDITTLVDSFNWHILPVHNPDGYEFSRCCNRLWRKTRSPTNFTSSNGTCYGVDPNRNWDVAWGVAGPHTNGKGCNEEYYGPEAHSEPCVKNVAQYIMSVVPNVKIAITFHTYSQVWAFPYGYNLTRPKEYDELYNLAGVAASALESVYGTKYTYNQNSLWYNIVSGSSMDWFHGKAGIKYSFTVELRDTGKYCFIAPASEIKPSGEETWAAVKALVNAISAK